MIKISRSPAVLLLIIISALLFAAPAIAESKKTWTVEAFYTEPSPLPAGVHGDLIRSLKAKIVIPEAPPFDSWQIMYRSSDALGMPNVVTGTVIVPEAWDHGNVVVYCPATQGFAPHCAPSFQFRAGNYWENNNIVAILKAGFAVLISDYPGYTTGAYPSYCNAYNQGHAALDIIKASRQIPYDPFSRFDKVVTWGYDQGGQTAAWAGQLQPSYMPDLNLVGVVAGGIVADLIRVGRAMDGGPGSNYYLLFLAGLYYQYPNAVPLYDLASEGGIEAFEGARDYCVFDGLRIYMHVGSEDLTKDRLTIDGLIKKVPRVAEIVDGMKLGKSPINAPVYLYHGSANPFIPMNQALDLKEAYCKMGMDVAFQVFPAAGHIVPQFQVAPYVSAWMKDRFNGEPLDETTLCSTGDRPVSDAQAPEDDYVIQMENWHVDGMVEIENLKQEVKLPDTTTMTCGANVSSLRLENGSIDLQPFKVKVRVAFLPMKVGFRMEQLEPFTGSLYLDSIGTITMNGVIKSHFHVKKWWGKARTATPVEMKLFYKGPVADFASGKMVLEGETVIPKMKGMNFLGGIVASISNRMMSGPMKYRFRAYPVEPYMLSGTGQVTTDRELSTF
ncbi:MAG: lipase family protein [Thermodesulfobacteriota bacterium]|nr:lipase family protein [Thermodesulfobacteriota bacterium]